MPDTETPIRIIIPGPEGAGQEVFEGDTYEEAAQRLAEAKGHATAKIRDQNEQIAKLKGRLEALEETRQQAPAAGEKFDRERFFQMMANAPEDALDYYWQHKTGMRVDELVKDYVERAERQDNLTMAFVRNTVAGKFAQQHPELLQVAPSDDEHNGKVLDDILKNRNWEFNIANLEQAFNIAKQEGKLKLPAPDQQQEQHQPYGAPPQPPVTVSPQRSGPVPDPDSEFNKWAYDPKTSLDELRRKLEERGVRARR